MTHGTTIPAIAVVTPNILSGLGLRTILEKVIPSAEIAVFGSFAEFAATDTTCYVHYFIAVQTFVRHSDFFRTHAHKTILLSGARSPRFPGMRYLDTGPDEQHLVHDLLRLRSAAPRADHALPHTDTHPDSVLTPRETEVLALIAHGLRNKQIADRLHIGLTTVISHRRNIMEKLHVKSVAGLVIHAISLGYAEVDEP